MVLKAVPVRGLVWRKLGQPGDRRILRGVADGVAEEARTGGLASLSLNRFAFS